MRGEFIDVGGARLYYYAAGTRGSGEPILLIHGFPTSSHVWSAVVPLLPAGHRVVVPDLLGFGRSDPPATSGPAADVTVGGHAARLHSLLDALHVDRAYLVGHGLGAAVALAVAAERPERVTRLCLVNPVTGASWPTRYARLVRAAIPLAAVLPPSWLGRPLRLAFSRGYAGGVGRTRSADFYLRPFANRDGRPTLIRHLRAVSVPPAMPSLAPPGAITTALLLGADDRILPPADASPLRAFLPQATLDVIPGGHYLPEESPEQVAAAIARLLSAHDSASTKDPRPRLS